MAARTKRGDCPAKAKYRYQVKNWVEYDRALVNRGNLTLWFDEDSIGKTWTPPRPVGRGKPGTYSDVAIQTCLTLKTLFRLRRPRFFGRSDKLRPTEPRRYETWA